jgi:kynurenine formamidase
MLLFLLHGGGLRSRIKASLDIGYCHIERLGNLELLPADGFLVCCFPFKVRGASAGFTRAVAIL